MKLRELFEAENRHITFCFGRMNPPTIGHAQVFKTMAQQGGDFQIFVSQSQDKKDNPLSYDEKIKFIKAIHPQYAEHIVENTALNTVVKVAAYLYEEGYRHATFVAGSDRLDSFKKLLSQYNGVEGKAHGYYKFELLDFVSAGERDPDSEGVSGVSASKARAAAATNDFEAFKEATRAGGVAKEMFAAVRQGMGINESVDTLIELSDDEAYYKFIVAKIKVGRELTSREKEFIKRYHLFKQTENVKESNYGRYWCSTDKKWKIRKGPKQKRST